MSILLPVVIFAGWLALVIAPAGRLAIEDAKKGVPKAKRRGVSLLPGFPVMPLLAWGAVAIADHFVSPWGSWIGLVLHSILLAICVPIIIRDISRLRATKP